LFAYFFQIFYEKEDPEKTSAPPSTQKTTEQKVLDIISEPGDNKNVSNSVEQKVLDIISEPGDDKNVSDSVPSSVPDGEVHEEYLAGIIIYAISTLYIFLVISATL
jgi:hypothetical protein